MWLRKETGLRIVQREVRHEIVNETDHGKEDEVVQSHATENVAIPGREVAKDTVDRVQKSVRSGIEVDPRIVDAYQSPEIETGTKDGLVQEIETAVEGVVHATEIATEVLQFALSAVQRLYLTIQNRAKSIPAAWQISSPLAALYKSWDCESAGKVLFIFLSCDQKAV